MYAIQNNPILAIIFMVICMLLYWFAYKLQYKNKYGHALACMVIAGFILRIFIAADPFLHEWDERYHALVAKNLIDSPFLPMLYENPIMPFDYRHWAGSHIWLHKQPLPLWSMALSLKVFGFSEFAIRIPSIILSSLAIVLTYYIGKYFFGKKIGLIAAFLFSINGLILELTGGRVATDHIDIHFLFYIELAIVFSIIHTKTTNRRWMWSLLIGFAVGAGILTKWLPALIVFPVWFLIAYQKNTSILHLIYYSFLAVIAAIIVALPWQLYILDNFPKEALWEYQHNVRHITEELDGNGKPWYYHLDKLRIIYGELIYLPLIWFFWKSIKKGINKHFFHRFALIIWISIPILFFSLVSTKMQGYTLFVAPGLFIVIALFWRYLSIYQSRFQSKVSQRLILIIIFLLLALPIRYSFERIKFFSPFQLDQEMRIAKNLPKYIECNDKVILFNTKWPIESMFYNNITAAYSSMPNVDKINQLKQQGYQLFYVEQNQVLPLSSTDPSN